MRIEVVYANRWSSIRRAELRQTCELHGVGLADCATCVKYANECDHGGCFAPPVVVYRGRPCCLKCSEAFKTYDLFAGCDPATVEPLSRTDFHDEYRLHADCSAPLDRPTPVEGGTA
ncbi:hypothetical protein [Nonomuraea sediminis]|uniref:hypothetical protein n=1 Tax=Nonomuraea sediminis TaxID=2835864 RepID=UPI001BDD08A1|nr:hypothetical protein [Nonomuraea sediminis]